VLTRFKAAMGQIDFLLHVVENTHVLEVVIVNAAQEVSRELVRWYVCASYRDEIAGLVGFRGRICPSGFKSSTFHRCSYFPGFIPRFNGAMLSVTSDVPVDNDAPVMTSWISKAYRLSPSEMLIGFCIHVFTRVSVRACVGIYIVLCNFKKYL
jgi:hypothetical protein